MNNTTCTGLTLKPVPSARLQQQDEGGVTYL
jgi:hypothetical protein